jgi:hypothetical protein
MLDALEERPAVGFLYRLMLTELPPGRVGELVDEVLEVPPGVRSRFANEQVARYAVELADRLGIRTPAITVERRA